MEGKPAHLRGLIDTNVEIGVRHGAVLIDLSTALTGEMFQQPNGPERNWSTRWEAWLQWQPSGWWPTSR